MTEYDKLIAWIMKITVGTLALICFTTVSVLLVGLFQENIDNAKIFEVIAPAFNTVIGAFVGLLGGLSINAKDERTKDSSNDQMDS